MLLEASYGQLATPFPLRLSRRASATTPPAFDEVTQVRFDAPFQNFFQRGFMRTLGGNFALLPRLAVECRARLQVRRRAALGRSAADDRPERRSRAPLQQRASARRHRLQHAGHPGREESLARRLRPGQHAVRPHHCRPRGLRYEWWRGDLPAQANTPDSYSDVFGGAKTFPEQKGLIEWTTWSPRTGLVWDVLGNSRLVTKFTYGRYFNQIEGNRINNSANRNGIASARYDWLSTPTATTIPIPASSARCARLNPPAQRSILPDLEVAVLRRVQRQRREELRPAHLDVGALHLPLAAPHARRHRPGAARLGLHRDQLGARSAHRQTRSPTTRSTRPPARSATTSCSRSSTATRRDITASISCSIGGSTAAGCFAAR